MTLRETFQITAIPDTLLELINAVLADASRISNPSFPIAEIRAASAALSPIPTLLLALYRATARSFYSSSPVADILIYNDASELATRLERLLQDLPEEHPLARRLPRAIESEIKSLQSFSRLAYGREMDSQRTILSDLLLPTAGFESCTNPLNAREYTSAIEDVVARLRDIDKLWRDVLCDSARKQSLGTLLSHVTRKLVSDILELADAPAGISEPESKQLKAYLDSVAKLASLFSVQDGNGEERTLVHVYTPSWLRFVYLGELLEASLADIKFLWTEGELSLEFEADEVVELIQALFAESEHRRGAIREIKRSAR
jgi:centromere/kinetochore protein ZW10